MLVAGKVRVGRALWVGVAVVSFGGETVELGDGTAIVATLGVTPGRTISPVCSVAGTGGSRVETIAVAVTPGPVRLGSVGGTVADAVHAVTAPIRAVIPNNTRPFARRRIFQD